MKRKNFDYPKLRRSSRRNKINENIYGSTFLYIKFFLIWAIVLLADFILEFRFEYLWPFWLLLRSVYDSFKYQGLAFSIFFICIALTSDMICLLSIPVHWLFFAASTYVWVQFIWHTERGICLPTISLWLLFVYIEASVRLRELKNVPFHLDLCRPFAAHCIGYPMVTLGFGFKSYIGYRLRQKKQRNIAKENNFYHELLQKALPNDLQQKEFDLADALSSYTNNADRPPSKANLANGSAKQLANSFDDYSLCNGNSNQQHYAAHNNDHNHRTIANGHCNGIIANDSGGSNSPSANSKLNGSCSLNSRDRHRDVSYAGLANRLATFLFSAFSTKHDFYYGLNGDGYFAPGDGKPPPPSMLDHGLDPDDQLLQADEAVVKPSSLAALEEPKSVRKKAISFAAGGLQPGVGLKNRPAHSGPTNVIAGPSISDGRSGSCGNTTAPGSANASFLGEPGDAMYMEVRVNKSRKENANGPGPRGSSPGSQPDGPPPASAANAVTVNGGFCLNDLSPASNSTPSSYGKPNNTVSTYKRPPKNSNLMETYLQKDSQINPNNTVFKDDTTVSSKFTSSPTKDETLNNSLKLELEVRKYKNDLQTSRNTEQELREQINHYQISEKATRLEVNQLRQDNESLQNKIHNLVTLKQQDKQLVASLEKKLGDEQKFRAKLETQILEKKVQVKRQNEEALMLFNGKTTMVVGECNEVCKNRRKDLENDIRQLCRDAKSREDQIWILEKELQTLRQIKDQQNDKDILLTALSAMKNKNIHLETSLNAETKLKLDLFSALSEAKRNLEINQSYLAKRDNEIADLKGKVAEIMAVMPTAAQGPGTSPLSLSSPVGRPNSAVGTSRYSPLAPSSPSPHGTQRPPCPGTTKDSSPSFYTSLFSTNTGTNGTPPSNLLINGCCSFVNGGGGGTACPSPPFEDAANMAQASSPPAPCFVTCNNNPISEPGLKLDQLHHKFNPSAAIYNPLLPSGSCVAGPTSGPAPGNT